LTDKLKKIKDAVEKGSLSIGADLQGAVLKSGLTQDDVMNAARYAVESHLYKTKNDFKKEMFKGSVLKIGDKEIAKITDVSFTDERADVKIEPIGMSYIIDEPVETGPWAGRMFGESNEEFRKRVGLEEKIEKKSSDLYEETSKLIEQIK
jgi:hypothetical protein